MKFPVMATAFLAVSVCAFGQQVIVTAEGHHGSGPPEAMKDDISVEVNKRPAQVEKWIPLRGDHAGLELYIVIDEGEDTQLGSQFKSLKDFIHGQPGTARLGLAYLRYGAANIVAPLTADHDQVARAASPSSRGARRLSQPLHGNFGPGKKMAGFRQQTRSVAHQQRYRSVVLAFGSAEPLLREGN